MWIFTFGLKTMLLLATAYSRLEHEFLALLSPPPLNPLQIMLDNSVLSVPQNVCGTHALLLFSSITTVQLEVLIISTKDTVIFKGDRGVNAYIFICMYIISEKKRPQI